MDNQDKFDKLIARYPHPTKSFYARPHLTRRHFFQLAGAGVTASFLANRLPAAPVVSTTGGVTTKNTAKNVVFILLAGAPSHTDTFDLKMIEGTTPATVNPATVNGVFWPTGLMPKLAGQMDSIAVCDPCALGLWYTVSDKTGCRLVVIRLRCLEIFLQISAVS